MAVTIEFHQNNRRKASTLLACPAGDSHRHHTHLPPRTNDMANSFAVYLVALKLTTRKPQTGPQSYGNWVLLTAHLVASVPAMHALPCFLGHIGSLIRKLHWVSSFSTIYSISRGIAVCRPSPFVGGLSSAAFTSAQRARNLQCAAFTACAVGRT